MSETGPRVLVFGLDQHFAAFMSDILTEDGYQVTIANSRPAALNLAKSVNPDVILVDLALSVCSCGWDLVTELRSNQDTSDIPLLAISDTNKGLEDVQHHLSVCHEIIKPYDIDDIERGISAAVAGVPLRPKSSKRPTTSDVGELAADAVARESHAIMVWWLRRVQRDRPELAEKVPARLLMNNATAWQIAVVSVLRYGPEEVSSKGEIRDKILIQIQEIRRHGFTLAQIVGLFDIFRDELWLTLDRTEFPSLTGDDVPEVARELNMSLDAVMEQVAEIYAIDSAARIS